MAEKIKNKIEERYYTVWINPKIKDNYQRDNIGTSKGISINTQILQDSASAVQVSNGNIGKGKNFAQTFYLSPGITVTAIYSKGKNKRLRKVVCTGHPDAHEASKSTLEKLFDVKDIPGLGYRIKLIPSLTQPI
jgi:hypothetical protein